jgi:hypothetical protein
MRMRPAMTNTVMRLMHWSGIASLIFSFLFMIFLFSPESVFAPLLDLPHSVHPNAMGYALMTQIWYQILIPLLP